MALALASAVIVAIALRSVKEQPEA